MYKKLDQNKQKQQQVWWITEKVTEKVSSLPDFDVNKAHYNKAHYLPCITSHYLRSIVKPFNIQVVETDQGNAIPKQKWKVKTRIENCKSRCMWLDETTTAQWVLSYSKLQRKIK